ncbi:hypothetical protein [Sphingomonas crocodyli]|uniref:Uncharacterized protein n=1 Tax=Sphingomonas crocodyli TaxID=1979270 RepID=A0A437M796_9SPHN|nr:hypothetical protein [Sphingomonas crocodyli]RVT93374.1 hypothetical protein EOD43_05705 [Sphingomonas crocodyli]
MMWRASGAALIALIVGAAFWIMGSAIVFDRSGQVASAAITSGGPPAQPLHVLPFGLFYAVPQHDGTIEITCRDGSRARWGYVSGYVHTWLRVEKGQGCRDVANDSALGGRAAP